MDNADALDILLLGLFRGTITVRLFGGGTDTRRLVELRGAIVGGVSLAVYIGEIMWDQYYYFEWFLFR